MDITINGSGTKDCYYYWKLPININLHGSLDFSAYLWMDPQTSNYVKIGYHYGFPPTGLERTPAEVTATQFNTWWKQSKVLSDDVVYHADYFSDNKIYNSTRDDFGRELQFIQLIIRGNGTHRLVFYLDKIEIKGTIINPSEFVNKYTTWWNDYKSRISSEVNQKRNAYNNLEAIPDISGKNISPQGKIYYNNLVASKSNMSKVLSTMDNALYFGPEIMDSMNTLLGLYTSWISLLKNEINNPGSLLNIFTFSPTVYNRLDETNLPIGLKSFDKLKVRACAGEYEPLTILLQAKNDIYNINFRWSDFIGAQNIPSTSLDISIAKVWYQAGITEIDIRNKLLTQELLIKNDSLIKLDFGTRTNYLLVTNSNGQKQYIDISSPTAALPAGIKITDSPVLLPFKIVAGRNKQIWLSFHIPENASTGTYVSEFQLYSGQSLIKKFPVEIEVLPFKLDQSRLTYGIFYNGYLDNYTNKPFNFTNKTEAQLRIELQDMKNHGVLYPTTYQVFSNIDGDLKIRNEVGLPNDRLYSAGICTRKSTKHC